MENLARKIIDAVQHSMLDKLFVRVVPQWSFLSLIWMQLSPSASGAGAMVLFAGIAGLWLVYSLLDAVADQSPRPRPRTPYDPVYEFPPDSLLARDRQSSEGLRPPPSSAPSS